MRRWSEGKRGGLIRGSENKLSKEGFLYNIGFFLIFSFWQLRINHSSEQLGDPRLPLSDFFVLSIFFFFFSFFSCWNAASRCQEAIILDHKLSNSNNHTHKHMHKHRHTHKRNQLFLYTFFCLSQWQTMVWMQKCRFSMIQLDSSGLTTWHRGVGQTNRGKQTNRKELHNKHGKGVHSINGHQHANNRPE